jgi:hypothetical protein
MLGKPADLLVFLTPFDTSGYAEAGLSRSANRLQASPVGKVAAGVQSVRVPGTEDPLPDRQQRGVLVAGTGRIPRFPGVVGQAGACGQGVRMFSAQDSFL